MGLKPFSVNIENSIPQNDGSIILDFSKPISQDQPLFVTHDTDDGSTKKRKGRPRKTADPSQPLFVSAPHMGTQVAENFDVDDKGKRELTFLETNEPYDGKYQETNAILRSAIIQVDSGLAQVQEDINDIRHNKTLRNKYQYLSTMQQSIGNLISNKISAARELNNTISKCNEFELKRFKEIRSNAAANEDDDQRVMEMYKAFVNTPTSTNPFPNVSQMAINGSASNIAQIGNPDAMYNAYLTNMTPQQTMMHIEDNPNIQQVVIYNQETGARYFDIIDMTTGQSVPNSEKHDAMFLEDIDIDMKNKIARNVNIGETYPLVIVGQPLMNEY